MLKWAIAKEDRRDWRISQSSTSTTSSSNNSSPNTAKSLLRKRPKLSHSNLPLFQNGKLLPTISTTETAAIVGAATSTTTELISAKARSQPSKQHYQEEQKGQQRNNSSPTDRAGGGERIGPTTVHCRQPDNNNTCNSNDHRGKRPAGHNNPSNDSHNCIINSSNTTTTASHHVSSTPDSTLNCTSADSKSLLYMSLDHLPLAIVKQYERMLKEQEEAEDNNNNNKSHNNKSNDHHNHASLPIDAPKSKSQKASRKSHNIVNKKCLSFTASTLPYKFKSKLGVMHGPKKIILPLHGHTVTTSSVGSTRKSLNHVSKLVRSGSSASKTSVSSKTAIVKSTKTEPPGGGCRQDDPKDASSAPTSTITSKGLQPTAVAATTTTTTTVISSCSPSPLSISSAGLPSSRPVGNNTTTEMIRHARSRPLKTSSSFRTQLNDDEDEDHNNNNRNKINARRAISPPSYRRGISHGKGTSSASISVIENQNKDSHKSEQLYDLPSSSPLPYRSSTLPRAARNNQSNNNKNSTTNTTTTTNSSQTTATQTYKSILKNSRELNNNNVTIANHNNNANANRIIDNLPTTPLRRPFQSLLNVSTTCNPPTPEMTELKTNRRIKLDQNSSSTTDTTSNTDEDEEEEEPAAPDKNRNEPKKIRVITDEDESFRFDHDTTDPGFLEKSLTFSFPAVTKCAKKLTLKRSELRKLERIRSQTDKLNRFLRKYYHECLPNLPEEEESQCSPEEKSLSLILRRHWKEEKFPNLDSTHSLPRTNSNYFAANTVNNNPDDNQLTNLFNNNTTTSSSSISTSSNSSCSSCSSSSSSSDLDCWQGYVSSSSRRSTKTHHHHQRYRDIHHHPHHGSSKRRQKRHSRAMLTCSNETSLLPIIQEDSAEVSSASVKSLESCRKAGGSPRVDQSHTNRNEEKEPSAQLMMNNNNNRISHEGNLSSLVPVKHDNMEQVEDPSDEESYDLRRNSAFVTEGAETDFGKLKGPFMFDGKETPFDVPTTLPFADDDDDDDSGQLEEENLENPQQRFTHPHPSPPSSTGSLLLPENTDTHSLGSSTSSHGYGSGSGTTIRTPEETTPVQDDDEEEEEDEVDEAIITDLPVQRLKQQQQHADGNESRGKLYGKKNDDDGRRHCNHVDEEDGDEDGNSSRATISSTTTTNANYPSETENETWNSHEYPSGSQYEFSNDEEGDEEDTTTNIAQNYSPMQQRGFQSRPHLHNSHDTDDFDKPFQSPLPLIVGVHRKEKPSTPLVSSSSNTNNGSSPNGNNSLMKTTKNEDESLADHGPSCVFRTPIAQRSLLRSTPMKKATPRKLVRKPPVKSIYSGRGEVMIRTYSNGDYVTLHVVHAKNLQPSYRSSWKLAIKISLLPDAEATFTKLESVEVNRNRTWVKIDQKFSFEVSNPEKFSDQKVFLTFWKRVERKTLFLGWTTLDPSVLSTNSSNNKNKTTQCWLKLRKRKMNATSLSQTATYTPAAYSTTASMHAGGDARTPSSKSSPLPLEIETLEEVQTPDTQDEDNNHYDHHHHSSSSDNGVKSHFPNSATMDSGVEDCCEPAGMQPSIELDETQGRRIMVKMSKQENQGYGFSVVWVSPPRIERLEKDKVADLAGLRIGDLIIGVNGEDVTTVPNTTIYHSMKTTGNDLELEVWRKNPPAPTPATVVKSNDTHIGSMVMMLMTGTGTPRTSATTPASNESLQNAVNNNNNNNNNNSNNNTVHCPKHGPQPHQHHHHHHHHSHSSSTSLNSNAPHLQTENANSNINSNSSNQHHHQSHHHHPAAPQQQQQAAPAGNVCSVHNIPSTAVNIKSNNPPIKVQLPPVSILKPPPPAPPAGQQSPVVSSHHNQQRNPVLANKHPTQPTLNSSSWKIRFNVELLDNEEDSLKQFFICELKFFRKVVAALDRYLIPAQAKKLLSPQEIHSIFSHIINIITMTKRILQCVANGAPKTGWRLGDILFSTHSDHLTEIKNGYTSYAHNLGNSALILGEKMTLQSFARFVLETPVPKGHLDITSLLFAPLEHLRNLCEICDEIVHHFDHWTDFSAQLKECYANIVVHTDYMEPISHISMKKHPLLSVRDLEKRIVSTTCQPLKVNEKGRKWLFGSRLFRKETDGSWAPVWAFIFTDIIVLTSHMTRDRVFFVKEAPIRLEDVVTLHFNLPKKNENEFRLFFGPEPSQTHYGRFDRILPIYRRSKSNQICLRTSNLQLKSIWKLLLQRQIITLNTRMSKSSSSNFSISEFCEKFPVNDKPGTRHEEKIDEEPEEDDDNLSGRSNEVAPSPPEAPETPKTPDNRCSTPKLKIVSTPAEVRKVSMTTEKGIMSRAAADSSQKPSSSTSIMSKDPPNRIAQVPDHSSKQLISESSSVVATTLKGATVAPSVQQVKPPTIDPDRTMSPAHTVRRGSKSTVIPSRLPTTRITTIEPATNHVPLILDLTAKATTGTTAGTSQGAIVKSREPSLSSVVSPSPDVSHSRKSSTGKFTQKPVEMLVSPSEGSPSKSYLNSRKNSAKSESIVNNNNDSLQDMNHVIHAIQESKSECEEDETPILFTTDSPEKSHVESTSTQNSQSMQTQTDKIPLSASVVEKTQKNDSTKTAASTKPNHFTQQLHHDSEGNGKPKDSRVSALLQAETQSKHGQVVGKGNELSSQREGFTTNNSGKSSQQSVDDLKTGIKIVSGEVAVGESSTTRIEAAKIMRVDLSGPKIMTNSILRSRQQQELMASSTSVVVNSDVQEDSKACESTAGKAADDVSKEPIIPSNGSVSKRHVMAPSKRELERNPSQNVSNSCAMGKVYANSPIVSGIGSQRTRRRLLYDYKVRRDYPELFGITPKDRRSFIKRLGELEAEEEKTLVAPYYYHTTLSPLPRPKNGSAVTATATCEAGAGPGDTLATKYNNNKNGLAHMKIMSSLDDDEDDATSTSTGSITHSKRTMNGRAQPHCGLEDEEDSDGSSTTRHNPGNERSDEIQLPPHVPHRNHRSPEESSSNDSGISEEILLTNDGHANKNPSSSNTEGSDDMQLSNNSSTSESDPVKSARFPSTLREHEVKTRTVLPPPTARCAATPTTFVPKDSKDSPTGNHSFKLRTDNCSLTTDKSSGSSTASVALGQDIQAAKLHTPSPNSENDDGDVIVVDVDSIKDLHHQNSTTSTSTTTTSSTQLSSHAKMNHVCFVEGATRDGVETVVELASATTTEGHPTMTADKSTGTEDDDYCLDLSWLGASSRATSELTYRQLLADKREAFFTSPSLTDSPPHYRQQQQQQHHPSYYRNNSDSPTLRTSFSHVSSTSASSYSTHLPSQFVNPVAAEPLVVKIYDGDQVQSTAPPPATDPEPCERVMYTRLEKEKTALVERVESSDDSTSSSSDVASASPAAENGTTDPSWSSSSSSSLAGYSSSSIKEEPSPSTSAAAAAAYSSGPSGGATSSRPFSLQKQKSLPSSCSSNPGANSSVVNGFSSASSLVNGHKNMLVSSFLDSRSGPAIVVTEDSPETPKNGYSNSDEEMEEEQGSCSIISNGPSRSSEKNEFLRVESNDSTAENYGDDDDYNFDDDDEDLSHCSVATMNRYGTFESLEKLEGEDALGTMPEFRGNMPRSKARFTFDDDDDDDEDLFEEDFESDFNFRFPGQIQDNTYSVSRLGPLPPLLEEDYEDDMYEENRASSESPNNSAEGHTPGPSHHQHQMHQTGVRGDNPFLLARIATMYARSSISPLRIFRELLLKKRYRQWGYKE